VKFYTFLIALYGPHEAHILYPSYAECSAALNPTYIELKAAHDDVGVLCEATRRLSASSRPKARPW
jgi:hypothetical protein